MLVLVPLFADITLSMTFGRKGLPNMGISVVSAWYYITIFPFYIVYLVVAFAILNAWKKWKNRVR